MKKKSKKKNIIVSKLKETSKILKMAEDFSYLSNLKHISIDSDFANNEDGILEKLKIMTNNEFSQNYIYNEPVYNNPIISKLNKEIIVQNLAENFSDLETLEHKSLDSLPIKDKKDNKILKQLKDMTEIKCFENHTKEYIPKNKKASELQMIAEELLYIEDFLVINHQLFWFNGVFWIPIAKNEFITLIQDSLQDRDVIPYLLERDYNEIFTKLISNPAIQKRQSNLYSPKNLIVFEDGLFDIDDFTEIIASPEYHFFSGINVSIDEIGNKKSYYFEDFITSISTDETRESIRTLLLEVIATVISSYREKALFFFYGPQNTGKSTFADLCKKIVGNEFTISVPNPNSFSKRWTTGNLFGKKLCISPDISSVKINADSISILKSLTGKDYIEGEKKYKDSFYFKNEAAIIFCSNHYLSFEQFDKAFIDRVVYVPFMNSVPREMCIPDLSEKLFEERGYIIFEALKVLCELRERNFKYTEIDNCYSHNSYFYSDDTNNTDNFIDSCCTFEENNFISSSEIYSEYLKFCNLNNLIYETEKIFSSQFKRLISDYEGILYKRKSDCRGYLNLKIQHKSE